MSRFCCDSFEGKGTPERHVADVTQQLLIAIAKSVDGWKADGKTASFRRWLGCVARNVVIKFMVRERKHVTGQGGSDFLTALEETVDPSIDAELQRQYEQELDSVGRRTSTIRVP